MFNYIASFLNYVYLFEAKFICQRKERGMKKQKRNSILKRGSALLLVLATIATTLPSSGLFADELNNPPAEETQEVSEEITTETTGEEVSDSAKRKAEAKEAKEAQIAEKSEETQTEPEVSPIEAESVSVNTLYAKVTEGGFIEASIGEEKVTLTKSGEQVLRTSHDGVQEDVSEQAKDGYYPLIFKENSSIVAIKVQSESGFKIESYCHLIDSGEEDIATFESLSLVYTSEVTLDSDKFLSASFNKIEDANNGEVVAVQPEDKDEIKADDTNKEEVKIEEPTPEEAEKILEEQVKQEEPKEQEVPEESQYYQKNEDGSWDYSTFPIVEEDPDEGTIVLGPDGVEYPLVYLLPNQEFLGVSNSIVKSMMRSSRAVSSTEWVTITKSGITDKSGNGYTNVASISNGATGMCVTGLESFPHRKSALASKTPGTGADQRQKRMIAMFLTNEDRTCVVDTSGKGIPSASSIGGASAVWAAPFGHGGYDNRSSAPSWYMSSHILGSFLSYGDARYNPLGEAGINAIGNTVVNLDNWINSHSDLIAQSTLVEIAVGGYQTIAYIEFEQGVNIDFQKTVDDASSPAGKDLSGCQINIYATKEQAKTANKNAIAGKSVPNPIAKLVTNSAGIADTKVGIDSLKIGTIYYATEVVAPAGYAISEQIFKNKMIAGETWSITLEDGMLGDPNGLILYKYGDDGLHDIAVSNAIFRVRYYSGGYDDKGNLTALTNTWYIKINSKGFADFSHLYSDDTYKSDAKPTGGFQPGIYVYNEVKSPAGFKKISGNLVITYAVKNGVDTWTVDEKNSTGAYLVSSANGAILGADPTEKYVELNEPVKYYGFKMGKMDELIYTQMNWSDDSKYNWSSIFGKTQGKTNLKKIYLDVYNWSGSSYDENVNRGVEGEDLVWKGKHDVSYKKNGEGYGFKEKVCTLTLDTETGMFDSGINLSEGYYKLVERASENPYYGEPRDDFGGGVWYISLNDYSTDKDGYYIPYAIDEEGDLAFNRDGYCIKNGEDPEGQNPNDLFGYDHHVFFSVEPVLWGDMIAVKIDSDMYDAKKADGSPYITSSTTSFRDLLYAPGFGFTLQEARGQLQTLNGTTFRIRNNNNNAGKIFTEDGDIPDSKVFREVGEGGIIYDDLSAGIYCVEFLKERYRRAWDRFDEELEGDIGVHGASEHQCDGGCKKYVCAVVLAHKVNEGAYMQEVISSGSLPAGDYILEEVDAGKGYIKKSTNFNITPGKCSLVQDTNIGKGYYGNTSKKIGVKVQKVVETDPTRAGFAPGDTSLGQAEFSIINQNDGNSSGSFGGIIGGSGIHRPGESNLPTTWEFRKNIDTGKLVGYGEEVMRIKTNASGIAESGVVLPVGRYEIREVVSPEGLQVSNFVGTIDSDVNGFIKEFTLNDNFACVEPVDRGGIEVYKLDKELKQGTFNDPRSIGLTDWGQAWGSSQGDGFLSGIQFKIINRSTNAVPALDSDGPSTILPGQEVGRIETRIEGTGKDLKAVARTGDHSLVYGTYDVQEVATNGSYLLTDGSVHRVVVHEDGVIKNIDNTGAENKYYDNPRRGGISVTKRDSDMLESTPTYHNGNWAEGDATRAGAEFQITNRSSYPVLVDGTLYNVGEVVKTITTNADGFATTANNTLPYGTYEIQETKAPTGYLIDTKWNAYRHTREGYVTVHDNNVIVALDTTWKADPSSVNNADNQDPVIRGGVQVIKKDKETHESEATGGRNHGEFPYAANLNGIEFTIKNVSTPSTANKSGSIYMPANVNGRLLHGVGEYNVGEDVMVITSHWNEAKNAYTAETGVRDLPYGTYEIRETKTNKSYKLTDKTVWRFQIREDGKIVTEDVHSQLMTYENFVIRADFNFNKVIDSTAKSVATPWVVTNVATYLIDTKWNSYFYNQGIFQ